MEIIRAKFLGIEETLNEGLRPKREYTIDLSFLSQCAMDEALAPVVKQYLLGLIERPAESYCQDYHIHYATRLLRLRDGAEIELAN